jgi:hypothetical protein
MIQWQFDESFGNNGIAAALLTRAHIYSIAIQDEGKIVATGQSHNRNNYILLASIMQMVPLKAFGINGFIITQAGISDD